MRVIGLMSGTSYDAIDAAAGDLTLDGDSLTLRPLGLVSEGYDDDFSEFFGASLREPSHPPFTRGSYGGHHDAGDSSRLVSRPGTDK